MGVRRVVTGHDPDGKAVFARDDEVEPVTVSLMPGASFHRLWGGDAPPTFPDDGSLPDHVTYFPPVGGFRFGLFTVPPDGDPELPADADAIESGLAEMEAALPGLLSHVELDNPGMHTTDTIDFEVVLTGEVTLELDDGATVVLREGDTVVQNGTRHRWSNHGHVPATLAVFIVGAHRA
jgi:hypothetical protein